MERIMTTERLAAFKQHLYEEERSKATIEKYLRDCRRFARFAGAKPLDKALVLQYKQSLIEQGYAVRSINSMLASINSFFRFHGWEDCRVKSLRTQRSIFCKEERVLEKTEYYRMLEAAKKRPRLQMLLKTICGTGIRVSELFYFTVENVKRGEVQVNCKGKVRTILLPGKLKRQLLAYAKDNAIKSGVIFRTKNGKPLDRSNIWADMKQLGREAGICLTKVFPHNLRKLFAKTFYAMEKDLAKLADILGHSSIETTRIYIMGTGREHQSKMERLGLVI